MKPKVLNINLILTSLFGYLEWGGVQSMFLFQGEWEIISKLVLNPRAVMHPLTLLPMAGQLILLFTLFQREPGKIPTFLGMAGICILMVFIFIIGLLSLHVKIFLSTLPFLLVAFFTVRYYLAKRNIEKRSNL